MKKNNLLKKGIVLGLMIVLFGASVVSSISMNTTEINTDKMNTYSSQNLGIPNEIAGNLGRSGYGWNVEHLGTCETEIKANKLVVQENYAYVVGSFYPEAVAALYVINISNPANPFIEGTCTGVYDQDMHLIFDIAIEGDYVFLPDFYATPQVNSGVWRVDVSDPENPEAEFNRVWYGNARAAYVRGDDLFVAEFSGGFTDYYTFDLDWIYGNIDTASHANGVTVRGNYAYIPEVEFGSGINALSIVDVSDPENMFVTHTKRTGGVALSVSLKEYQNNLYAFMADYDGLQVFDVTDPYEITSIIRYDYEWCGFIEIVGDYAYLATGRGLEILDISDPLNAELVGYYYSPGASGLAVQGDLIYVSNWEDGVKVFRFTGQEGGWPNAPITPSGPIEGVVNTDYTFTTNTTDPEGDAVSYGWDWNGDHIVDEWTDFYESGFTKESTHNWTEPGEYELHVKAKDKAEHLSDWSDPFVFSVIDRPPETPSISGPDEGDQGIEYTFFINTTDPDGDDVSYGIDWDGDSMVDDWTDYYLSGETVEVVHAWDEQGDYEVKVKAKDVYGNVSDWSDIHDIHITSIELIAEISGGFGITLTIDNTGDADANDVEWSVTLEGGFILIPKGGYADGTIDTIPAGDQAIEDIFVFGLGSTLITIEIQVQGEVLVSEDTPAFVFGPIVIIR